MNTHDIKVVAFDCDGVMFDTTEANRMYYNRILDHFNLPALSEEQFAYTHMHTVDAALDYIIPDQKLRAEADVVRKELNYFSLIPLMEIEPGLIPLLQKLKPDYHTAIATNRSDTMDRVVQEHGLTGLFDLVVSARDVTRAKPHPEPLLKILDYFGIQPQQALYIGDSQVDEQAARSAGIPLVAYDNPHLDADFHIQSLEAVAGLLKLPSD